MSLSLLDPEIVIDDLEEIWAESDKDIPCDKDCGRSAQLMVIWKHCPECGQSGGKYYYCLICYDTFYKPGDETRWASCENCDTDCPLDYVTTIR